MPVDRTLLILLFLLVTTKLFSQEPTTRSRFSSNFVFRYDYHEGKILNVYPSQPKTGKTTYHNLNFLWQTDGTREWHAHYNFPEVGANLILGNHGNDSIMGRSAGLFPNMIIKIRNEKTWGFYFKLGSGFAWFFKPYDRIKNPDNIIIGSHIVNVTSLGFNGYVKLGRKFDLHGGYSMIHYSSGHVKIPNVGSNDFPWNVGIAYKPMRTHINRGPWTDTTKKPILFNIRLGLGFHEIAGTVNPNGGPVYPVYYIAPYLSKRFRNTGNFHLGMCFTYYAGYYNFIKLEEIFVGKERSNSLVVSALIGREWIFGRMSLLVEPVINFYNPLFQKIFIDEQDLGTKKTTTVTKRWIGVRAGFMYYTLDKAKYPRLNPAVGMFIKTNRDQADYAEISVSCGL